ncbi:hypothetical protein NIES3585_40740 [Nodularia sp. NIES-3585]|nr:hypothetical protein NIES3585_40740 [Nodularia sp. NIES-3585]
MHLISPVLKPNSYSSDSLGLPAVTLLKNLTLARKLEQVKTNQHPIKQT